MKDWLPKDIHDVFQSDPKHILTTKEKKHRIMLMVERIFRVDLSKKHFKIIKK